jgi:hypothetical protein
MKSFKEFQEQVETAQEIQKSKVERNTQYIKAQIQAGKAHRKHVHNELASKAREERQDLYK